MVDAPPDEAIQTFPQILVTDTCAVWNVLCSRTLTNAARGKQRYFVLADYVRYECLFKPRRTASNMEKGLQGQLRDQLADSRCFSVYQLEIEDLLELVRVVDSPRRFDKGELAALALAMKLRKGFLTDDRAAKKIGEKVIGANFVRTTPHLVGWLVFVGQLSDGDIPGIIRDNKAFRGEKAHLGDFFEKCYEHALGLLLRERTT